MSPEEAGSRPPSFLSPEVVTCKRLLDRFFKNLKQKDFAIRLWDGTWWGDATAPRFTLVLRHTGAIRTLFTSPDELTLGEAYIYDDFDIEGDIFAAMELADYLLRENRNSSNLFRFGRLLYKLPRSTWRRERHGGAKLHGSAHSRQRDREAIHHHYDLPAEFYQLWLDAQMLYSCAYFASSEQTLAAAQLNKLDYLCRKLRLQRGERLLDIGCGWGALMMHAAAHYGVETTGITLSAPQAEFANAKIREAGLRHLCCVEVCDYRDFDAAESYDKLVSVGMFEHVGERMLPQYFRQAWRTLRRGGVFLNHGIATLGGRQKLGPSFATRYVFPDGELVPISTTLRVAEEAGFEVRDVETLREHYPLTLREWVRRLEANGEQARRITDDVTYRIWRLYMAGYARRFETAKLSVYQTLLAKVSSSGESMLPLVRNDWYEAH